MKRDEHAARVQAAIESYLVSGRGRRQQAKRAAFRGQRAMVAARLATLEDGQRSDHVEGLPIGRAAELLNVSRPSVQRARQVLDSGTPGRKVGWPA